MTISFKTAIAGIAVFGLAACASAADSTLDETVSASATQEKASSAAPGEKMGRRSGPVSEAAFKDRADQHFDRMDADGDGNITAEEKAAAKAERHEKMAARRAERRAERLANGESVGDGEGKMKKHRGHGKNHKKDHNPDSDGDGVVSRAEHDAMVAARFAKMDKNGDGVISEDEKPARKHRRKPQE